MTNQTIQNTPLDTIQPDAAQPRRHFDEAELNQFADYIRAGGNIPPVLVRKGKDGKTIIVHGERRWRASQLAGVDTIPTLIDERNQGPIDRLIEQVADNIQAELRPLEIAQFYDDLVSKHNIRNADIPRLLEAHGLKAPSREQVSAMRRLLKLPDWAQPLINNGTLTPSHGKHILTATGFPEVMNEIKFDIEAALVGDGNITIADLEDSISQAFNNHYIDIVYPSNEPPTQFDIATCKGCQTCKKLTSRNNGEEIFCLNPDCYEQKQTEAREAQKPAGNTKPTPPPSPADDNPESYEGHDATEAEQPVKSAPPEFVKEISESKPAEKDDDWPGIANSQPDPQAEQSEKLAIERERMQNTVDEWLCNTIKQHIDQLPRAALHRMARHCNIKINPEFEEYLEA